MYFLLNNSYNIDTKTTYKIVQYFINRFGKNYRLLIIKHEVLHYVRDNR